MPSRTWPRLDNLMSGGAQTFFHRGTNGRWKDVLTESDLELYEAAVARELSDECARWLEARQLQPSSRSRGRGPPSQSSPVGRGKR